VRQHAGQAARELARLRGGDYGRESFNTDGGEWTLKYEAGDIEFLRFEGRAGVDVYVISTQQPPEPEPLATAMAHYADFVAAFNDYVRGLDGVLDDVPTDFPDVETGSPSWRPGTPSSRGFGRPPTRWRARSTASRTRSTGRSRRPWTGRAGS